MKKLNELAKIAMTKWTYRERIAKINRFMKCAGFKVYFKGTEVDEKVYFSVYGVVGLITFDLKSDEVSFTDYLSEEKFNVPVSTYFAARAAYDFFMKVVSIKQKWDKQ